MKRKIKVNIMDSTYTIKTDVPEDDFKQIASILDKTLKKLNGYSGAISTHKIAILAALHFAAENYFITKKIDTLIKKLSEIENNL